MADQQQSMPTPGNGSSDYVKDMQDGAETIITESGVLDNNSAAKTAWDLYQQAKSDAAAYDYLNAHDPTKPNDYHDGVEGVGQLYSDMGEWLDNLGGLLPSGGTAVSQAGKLLGKLGDGLKAFGKSVLEPIESGLMWPFSSSTPDPQVPQSKPSTGDPLVLDLDGMGINLTPLSASAAYFDFSGSGFAAHTGWIGAGEGLLVTAPLDDSGSITSENLLGARTGNAFADLAAFDENGDGIVDSSDAAFSELRVWVDNGDGVAGNGELYSLSGLGITSISLNALASGQISGGNQIVSTATFTTENNGVISNKTIAEVNFSQDTQASQYQLPPGFELSDEAVNLPNLLGYGNLPQLMISMSLNGNLLSEVQSLVTNSGVMSASDFDTAFQNMLFEWAGASGIDPASRGPYVDAQHLAVVYAFYGINQSVDTAYAADPNWHNGPSVWEPTYRKIVNMLELRFVSQIGLSMLMNGASLDEIMSNPYAALSYADYDITTDRVSLSELPAGVLKGSPEDPTSAADYWAKLAPIFANIGINLVPGTAGDDVLNSSGASDIFVYRPGDGNDVYSVAASGATNAALWLDHLLPADIQLRYSGADLRLISLATGEIITITNQFVGNGFGIANLYFADGTTWNSNQILAHLEFTPSPSGNVTVSGTSGIDVLESGSGNERLVGGNGDDVYLWARGAGNDIVEEGTNQGKHDRVVLIGILPNDVQMIRNGHDLTLVVAAAQPGGTDGGSLTITYAFDDYYDQGVEQIIFADGTAWTRQDLREMYLANTGADQTFNGFSGNDTYNYARGDGNDVIIEPTNAGGADELVLTDLLPSDVTLVRDGNDLKLVVKPSSVGVDDGGSILIKSTLDDYYYQGVEKISFADGTSWTQARLREMLLANTPADQDFVGFAGNDTYYYSRGAGNDAIIETSNMGTDQLKLVDINPADVRLSYQGSDLIVTIKESSSGAGDGGSVRLVGSLGASYYAGVETIAFADGTVWGPSEWTRVLLTSTSVDETFVGFASNDTYYYSRGGGNDTITETSNRGTDQLKLVDINPADVRLSYQGSDLIVTIKDSSLGAGDGGSVRLVGSLGASYYAGVETIAFANGTVWGPSEWTRVLLTSTSADETFVGFASNDTYYYSRGGGNDTITETSNRGTDQLKLVDINPSEVRLSNQGSDLIVTINESSPGAGDGGSVRLVGSIGASYSAGVETIVFADGTVWGPAEWTRILLTSTSANEAFVGFASNDTYYYTRGGGNDTITETSNKGADQLKLVDINPAEVTLQRNGNHVVILIAESSPGAGDGGSVVLFNSINSSYSTGVERLVFADGTTWDSAAILAHITSVGGTPGSETISGTSAADEVHAGRGNDTLTGGAGGDTYIYLAGDGNDIVDEQTSGSDSDTLRLDDLLKSDVRFERTGSAANDAIIRVLSTGETITLRNQFNPAGGVESIVFKDGEVLGGAAGALDTALKGLVSIYGTAGNDTLAGTSDGDTFIGGIGDDRYNSGAGSDIYLYAKGDGSDYIDDQSNSTVDVDLLRFSDLNTTDVTFSRSGVHTVITVNETGAVITLDEQLASTAAYWGLERIQFADGTIWDRTQIQAASWIRGTAGNDTLTGTTGNDTLSGSAGNDTINGAAGNDTLYGDAGNDTLNGGDGNDAHFGGDGDDLLIGGAGVDSFDGGNGIDTLDFTYYTTASHTIDLGAGLVTFSDATPAEQVLNIENVVGGAGVNDIRGSAADNRLDGGAGNDAISGNDGNDILIGGAGNDMLTGGSGDDAFVFRAGFGKDTVMDFVVGVASDDFIDISTSLFADFASVIAAASQVGADTLITYNSSNTITLKNVALTSLHHDDFHFTTA